MVFLPPPRFPEKRPPLLPLAADEEEEEEVEADVAAYDDFDADV